MDIGTWIVAATTVFIVSLCVGLHYEVLRGCSQFLAHVSHGRRGHTMAFILIILATHVAEMWLFAIGFYFVGSFESTGSLIGLELIALPDYWYYSAMAYTTVGFGDIVPVGAVRFMTGMEALTGLVMITWSASFTFLVMERYWRTD